jgi:2-hydroxycyclohexanecarboxyl-CoA dehydrogenase
MDFTSRTAVVTGAASGIGQAVALGLAGRGAAVIAADRDLDGAKRTASRSDAVRAQFADVTDDASVRTLCRESLSQLGHVDIVVNAAGWDRAAPFLDTDEAFWRDVVDINYLGQVRMAHAFLPPMIEAGGGKVVNLSSDAGRVGSSGETVYAGAKGGVIAFTKSLAREMANCVCPGPTDTPLFAAQPERVRQALEHAIPFRRIATPEEVADAVLFFASDMARFITGQVLSVSGGLTMAG